MEISSDETAVFKSWAQQIEESYQLQLALALRLSSQAALATDLNALCFDFEDNQDLGLFVDSPEAVSYRFWVNGCLSYFDRIQDGFYLIHGIDTYAWALSTNQQEIGSVPSFELLEAVNPCDDLSVKVVLIDKSKDPRLKELHSRILGLSTTWITINDVVRQLANIVSNFMGGAADAEEDLCIRWNECAQILRDCSHSVVLPIGSLTSGLCIHRALLFKVLADLVKLPCRIAKGCKYCRRDDASSCLVQLGIGRGKDIVRYT